MFCKYCGNQLPDDANFCPKCGKVTDEKTNTTNESYSSYEPEPIIFEDVKNDFVSKQKDEDSGSILKFAILGLAFSIPVSILGLIFTIIAKSKVRKFINKYGDTEGRATVGKHLTIPGMICSIFFMVFWFIYTIFIVAVLFNNVGLY